MDWLNGTLTWFDNNSIKSNAQSKKRLTSK